MKLAGVSVLGHIQDTMITARMKGIIDDYVISTTMNPLDDEIQGWCRKYNANCFRGSEDDVLGRVYETARYMNADVIVDITADCPLVDYSEIHKLLSLYFNNFHDVNYVYVSNCRIRSWPDGFDLQVFSISALAEISDIVTNEEYLKHVGWNVVKYLTSKTKIIDDIAPHKYFHPSWGLTLDTLEDYGLLKILFERRINERSAEGIIDYLHENPELLEINRSVVRKVPGDG